MLAPRTSLPLSRGSNSPIRDKPPAADRHSRSPVDLVRLEDPGAAIKLGGGNKAKKMRDVGRRATSFTTKGGWRSALNHLI
jgi:hypothetical protein